MQTFQRITFRQPFSSRLSGTKIVGRVSIRHSLNAFLSGWADILAVWSYQKSVTAGLCPCDPPEIAPDRPR